MAKGSKYVKSTILVRGCLTMYTLCVCGKVSPAVRGLAIIIITIIWL